MVFVRHLDPIIKGSGGPFQEGGGGIIGVKDASMSHL